MKFVQIEGGKKLASFIEPMKAQLTDRPAFDSDEWLFEVKWDGYRAVAEVGLQGTRLYSRNGLTFDKAYPKVFDALRQLKKNCVLDGEIVVMDEQGKPSFQRLQHYKSTQKGIIQYYVFDILELEGKSLKARPLIERKAILEKLLPKSDVIIFCGHVENDGRALFAAMQQMNLEGMIAKRKRSSYHPGKRSADWLKIKNIQSQEAIIVGFTSPKGSRSYFGSLLLGVHKGKKLVSIGGVGTGFKDRDLKEIYAKLKPLIRKTSPLDVPIKETPDMTWVEPRLVCNITFAEITEDGSARHPVFQGLRIDKGEREVVLEQPEQVRTRS